MIEMTLDHLKVHSRVPLKYNKIDKYINGDEVMSEDIKILCINYALYSLIILY